jgi:hypothetical protein
MSAMLSFRHDEKLLDALLRLTEIFRLVSYIEHVSYALLNPAHAAPPVIQDFPLRQHRTAARGSISLYLMRAVAIVARLSPKCIKQRHATFTSDRAC